MTDKYAELREALKAGPTEGPWRWEHSTEGKRLHLVGGRPTFDLTIMDFTRWGMGSATVRLRDTAHSGLNLMHKLHDRPDWIEAYPGRDHHKKWCANVVHPDMRMIAAANPATIAALLAERDALLDAVAETARVLEADSAAITDTVWVTGGTPETLLDRCCAALSQGELQ